MVPTAQVPIPVSMSQSPAGSSQSLESYLRVQGIVNLYRHGDVTPTFPSNSLQLRPQTLDFLLVASDQGRLVHNFIALGCYLNLLGPCCKLEGVVGLLCLAGSWSDGADD